MNSTREKRNNLYSHWNIPKNTLCPPSYILDPSASISTKIFSTMQKFEFSSQRLDKAQYNSTNSPS